MKVWLRSIAALLLTLAVTPLFAQSLTGGITGSVKDQSGALLPGVTLTLAGKTGSRTTTSDAAGNYRFPAVDPGTYTLSAEISGFGSQKQDVTLSVGKQLTLDFSLGVGGKTENIEVLGEAPVVDVTSSATNNSLNQEILFNIPIDRRSFNVYNYAPGINDYSAYGGGQDTGNALLLDGVDTRDPEAGTDWSFFNYNIIQEVQIQGLGAPAEYGSFTGAIVNTVSKSGGNQFQGLFDVNYTKDSLAGDNRSAKDLEVNPALGGDKTTDYKDVTGQLSGPLIKDKLFFFASTQRFHKKQDPAGPRTVREELSHRFNTKVSWLPSSNDTLNFTLQYDDYNIHGRPGQPGSLLSNDQQTVEEDAPEWVWNVQWRHLFSSNTFLEAKYLGWWGYFDLNPINTTPSHFDGATGLYTGGGGFVAYYDRTRNEGHVALSHYADAWGKHELKFGAEIERSKVRDRYGYVSGGYFYDYGGVPYYQYQYSYDIQGKNQRESFYAQDSWKVNDRLTLNPGIRYDMIRGKSTVTGQKVFDTKSWGPRIGFAFDVTGDHKTVIKGFYGQYYEAALFSFYSRALPGVGDFVTLDPNTGAEIDRSVTPIYKMDPNIKQPHVNDYNVAFERAIGNKLRVQVTGIYRENKDFISSVIPSARWQPTVLANPLAGGAPLTVYQWANYADSSSDFLITNPDGFVYKDVNGNPIGTAKATRNYKGLQFVLTKRQADRWFAQASYVLSKAYGTVDSAGASSYGQGREFETPTLALLNSDGESIPSVRHEVKLYAGLQVPVVEIGVNAYFRSISGETYTANNRFGRTTILFPPSSTGRTPLLEPRGSRRRETLNILDLRLEKIFSIAGHNDRFGLYADITNVFNKGTVTNLATRVTGSSVSYVGPDGTAQSATVPFEGPLGLVAPRQVTLAARWSF